MLKPRAVALTVSAVLLQAVVVLGLSPTAAAAPPPVGTVFAGTSGGFVYQVAGDGSSVLWAFGLAPITALAVQEDGGVLVGDTARRLTAIAPNGAKTLVHTFGGVIQAIATDAASGTTYVAEDDGGGGANLWRSSGAGWVNAGGYGEPVRGLTLSPTGALIVTWASSVFWHNPGTTIATGGSDLRGGAWDPAGELVAVDASGPGSVVEAPATGGTFAPLFSGLNQPVGVALDEAGNRIVGSAGANGLYRVSPDGLSVSLFASVSNLTAVATYVPTPQISPVNPGDDTANVGTSYDGPDFDSTTPGGLAVTFSLYPGSDLPNGVDLDPVTGEVSGAPTETGTFTYRVQAANAVRATVSAPIDLVVGGRLPGSSTLEITSTPAASLVGAEYDVTTRLTPSGGAVTVDVPVASRAVCSIVGSTVTFDHAGTCTVRADYAGDSTTLASSAVQTIEVLPAATDLEVELLRDTIVATVTVVEPGGGIPTGEVVFTAGGVEIGTADLAVDGAGDLVAWVLAPEGPLDVTATYAGSDDHLGSVAATTRSDPTITAEVTSRRPASKHGWYRTPVKITFTCTVGSAPLVGGCPSRLKLTENRRGRQPITVGIVAEDGGRATVEVSRLRIDRTDPKVRVKGVGKGELRCVARDRLSGVASCRVITREDGDRVSYRAVAFDRAGNRTVVRGRYFLR